jgi:bla regulator protein blaR1
MLMLVLRDRSFSRNSVRSLVSLAAFVVAIAVSSTWPCARGQSALPLAPPPSQSIPTWQTDAGGHMSYEVASIRPGDPGRFIRPTIDLSIEDTLITPGGAFIADFSLPIYIEFAYKILLTREQEQAMVAHLPKWVGAQPFVIEAKAPTADVTKDQMRLMMQSLLADRFKLAVHFETADQPVLALVLTKPGTPGPRLRPHSQGLACDTKWTAPPDRTSPSVLPGEFVPFCGVVLAINVVDHTILFGARNVTLQSIAANLATLPPVAEFGRPVVNQTGLAGTYDFSLNWLPDRSGSASGAGEPPDAQGPSFLEALKEQLGLKLKPTRAVVQTLVIDHVEEPSPN